MKDIQQQIQEAIDELDSVGRLGTDPQETPTVFGYGGVGGSYAYADTATGVAFALTKNRLTPDFDAAERLSRIVMEALGGTDFAFVDRPSAPRASEIPPSRRNESS